MPPRFSPSPATLIAKKRDGGELSSGEIQSLIEQFLAGTMADYQMSAWLMAAYLRGLSDREMVALTEAMLHSGTVMKLAKVKKAKIDKHSTGGVGDKISLPLAPLVAAAGVAVPMISGRGLGHTGGTLDKLEAIPGFQVRLSAKQFESNVAKLGVAMMGQTEDIAPADRRIYALRDVTATVAYRPLIVASILSKKLAAGLDGLVLDVKSGRGAFMQKHEDAEALAKSLCQVSAKLGTSAVALLTNMDTPLGRTIGNALEVRESIEILRGEGPEDTTELTLELGAEMLTMGGLYEKKVEAKKRLRLLLESGKALERFGQMIEAQGGDPRVIDDPARLPWAPVIVTLPSPKAGSVSDINPLALAHAALNLGAGRKRAEDAVDFAVGLEVLAKVGTPIEKGEPLVRIHARSREAAAAEGPAILQAFSIRRGQAEDVPLVLGRRSALKRGA